MPSRHISNLEDIIIFPFQIWYLIPISSSQYPRTQPRLKMLLFIQTNLAWDVLSHTTLIWALLWEKRFFAYAKTKTQISCAVTAQLISVFVFAKRIVQSLFYLNLKFQDSSHLLWLYSPVFVGPGRKPRRPVFSERGSFESILSCWLLSESLLSKYSVLSSLWTLFVYNVLIIELK